MLPQLPDILPEGLGRWTLTVALALAGVGTMLWLAGSRFSRSVVTLVAVSAGAAAGMHLPGWFGWPVNGMGVAVGTAMLLGLSGYLLHTTWVGAGLALVLALWAAIGVWLGVGRGAAWSWPAVEWSAGSAAVLAAVWRSLPGDLSRIMPCAIAAGLTGGVSITVLWPKFARVLTYTLVGLSLVVLMGLSAMRLSRPQWLGLVPRTAAAQVLLLITLVALGVASQWRLTPAVDKSEDGALKPRRNGEGD